MFNLEAAKGRVTATRQLTSIEGEGNASAVEAQGRGEKMARRVTHSFGKGAL